MYFTEIWRAKPLNPHQNKLAYHTTILNFIQMKINVQPINCTPRQDLLNLVDEKMNKLSHFSDRILESKVVLRIEKSENRDNKIVEVRLVIPGKDLFVKKNCESFEEGVQKVYDILQREIKEWKEQVN